MGQDLLVNERFDAGEEFIREFDEQFPVSVACWINPADSDDLFLYVASDQISDANIGVAYGEVLRCLNNKRNAWLDPFQVKLVNSSDPIATDAIEIRNRYTAPISTHFNGTSIGGISIDGAYIYAPVSAIKSTS
jgi:hypothetical protein